MKPLWFSITDKVKKFIILVPGDVTAVTLSLRMAQNEHQS